MYGCLLKETAFQGLKIPWWNVSEGGHWSLLDRTQVGVPVIPIRAPGSAPVQLPVRCTLGGSKRWLRCLTVWIIDIELLVLVWTRFGCYEHLGSGWEIHIHHLASPSPSLPLLVYLSISNKMHYSDCHSLKKPSYRLIWHSNFDLLRYNGLSTQKLWSETDGHWCHILGVWLFNFSESVSASVTQAADELPRAMVMGIQWHHTVESTLHVVIDHLQCFSF